MKEEDIRQLLREYIVSTWLSGDSRDFNDETDMAQAGILDSFSTLAMASFIDERFRIRLEPSEINADSFRNVSSLTSIVKERMETAA
jgi:acyl carrier protein